MKRVFFFLIVLAFMTGCQKYEDTATDSLKCNYSSMDISTQDGEQVSLAGFADRKELSKGIHLRIRTYCLVLTDGKQKVCIISNDLMETSPALATEIQSGIRQDSYGYFSQPLRERRSARFQCLCRPFH